MLNKAINRLKSLRDNYQTLIKNGFEHRAKDCLTCETQGICCTDAHFVNVQITRLEAIAIQKTLEKLSLRKQSEIYKRNEETVAKYKLTSENSDFSNKFACPLFEKGTGCLVHKEAKPIPCIQHACYENKEDLPPNELQNRQEKKVGYLNTQTFGNAWNWLPLPVWLKKVGNSGR